MEDRTALCPVLRPDGPVVKGDDRLTETQPDSGSGLLGVGGGLPLVEGLEDLVQFFFGDAGPLVRDRQVQEPD